QNRFPLHRLLMVARLGPGVSAAAVAGYYRELFENILEDHSGEHISGLLLLHPSCIFHLVESCSSTIHLIIQDLASLQNQGHSALLQEIKVLVVAHNIPTRLCPDWYAATATADVTRPQSSPPAESTAEVVAECLALLPQVAACIQSLEDDSEEDMDQSVYTLAPEQLIPPETVDYLCHAEECSSPEDFLRTYLSPSQVALDSETVWPVPSHLSA
ncbi:TEX47 protein, partial [Eubucco bourcierii]|nr:TEX47 protein [Eubucco bourcierii]